jgi:hypothetical protein
MTIGLNLKVLGGFLYNSFLFSFTFLLFAFFGHHIRHGLSLGPKLFIDATLDLSNGVNGKSLSIQGEMNLHN